ncbi:MAG: sulfatase-like hydrolase/transferase [Planctomycetota bacterium]|nr:sulfatase-like hydrolase/transferase [Planctomycetota bacterium]
MPDRPNVLLVCTDHWPGSLLGEAGHPCIQTPTLDQLARNGVRFPNAYSECPVCIPARRTLMTGTTPRTHGLRQYQETAALATQPFMAQVFRDAGYQAYAVGKLHVYPQRSRIGFDDVILTEEGRVQFGLVDDYEAFLGERGYAGQFFAGGMCNNEYLARPWHLPEDCHITNWVTREMCRTIKRRDPRKPSFWYLSYMHPHPPLQPLGCYLDMYRDLEIDEPYHGTWSADAERLPHRVRDLALNKPLDAAATRLARRAFYALCTHIDHQLRVVLGTLKEEGQLQNTVLCFTSDHGDLLGNHGLWGKSLYYEDSARVPMLLCGAGNDSRAGHHRIDPRIVGWQDVMPTLLDLAGVAIPSSVDGLSMVGERKREYLYGEINEGGAATRMLRDARYKLIYYPTGNRVQLFDLAHDPRELNDLAEDPAHAPAREQLTARLIENFYGGDEAWARDGKLAGLPDKPYAPRPNRAFSNQRGLHWPPPGTSEA